MREVRIAGTGIVPFSTAGRAGADLALDAGLAALADAGMSFGEVQSVHTGYIAGGATTGVRVTKEFGLTGAPVHHVENASATGLATFRDAWMAVAGGHCDVALAVAIDSLSGGGRGRRRGVGGSGGGFMGGRNSLEGAILPAAFFAMWARRRMHEYGTTAETFATIAAKNWNHARDCSWAQRRSDHVVTPDEVLASRMIADPHTSMMSCGVSSGAAAAVLVAPDYAARLARRPPVRVLSAVMQSERYTDGHVFLGPVIGPSRMTADTAAEAYEKAGVGPDDLDLVQVHDAFPIEELVYYELLGICGDGEGDKLVASGDTRLGGRIPFSTDGGLIARGHPGGPTGLAQIHETVTQLEGRAGTRQVEGAKVGLCHLVGAGSTCLAVLLAR
jgi:acetyl-CoA acetyltransferase